MRHVAAVAVWLASLAGLGLMLDGVAARSAMPGTVWVLTGGEAAFARLLAADGVRVLDVWGRGRVVELAVPSTRDAVLPPQGVWASLRLSLGALSLAGCG